MAANCIVFESPVTSMNTTSDKSKEWQMEMLMEKLRTKSCQYKAFPDLSKAVRMALLEKRYSLDSVEKSQHQKCLDALQHCIKVTSLQSMVERLESLTRQLGLKFMVGPSGVDLFISSDMFYLEIILEGNDKKCGVRDVKIHHEGKADQQSCSELVGCLTRQDFADFTVQLEGLASIYQLNAEKKIKCKAFSALQSLETDLAVLAQFQSFVKDAYSQLYESPVGILEKRRGGHPMKLTYLVSPYELIDTKRGVINPLTLDAVTSNQLGCSVTVCVESSTAHKLPTVPITSINRTNNQPIYTALATHNSAVIPACFVLRLSKPIPIGVTLLKRIQTHTQLDCGADSTDTSPILSVITKLVSNGQLDSGNNRGLFVTLPDQHHCYFLTEGKGMECVTVNSVQFTHPAHVPATIEILRLQALFNTVLSSCIRPNSKQDFENMIMFEVTPLSWQILSISMEHPTEETMVTAEIDLTDMMNVACRIYGPGNLTTPCTLTSELATRVFKRSLSIPITMRAVIKYWEKMAECKKYISGNENFSLPLGSDDPGGHQGTGPNSLQGNSLNGFGSLGDKVKHEQCDDDNFNDDDEMDDETTPPSSDSFLGDTVGFPSFNPENLDFHSIHPSSSSMSSSHTYSESKKKLKRKADEDAWKLSPKPKMDEDALSLGSDVLTEKMTVDDGSSDDSISTPISDEVSGGLATPTSALGFQSDLELSGLDGGELITGDKDEYDCDTNDLEDILSTSNSEFKSKKFLLTKSPSDTADKSPIVIPSVSITPVISSSQTFNSALGGITLERRPGIEIIPIQPTSSVTITPITNSPHKSYDDKYKSKSKSGEKSISEKKRKRKRDDEEDAMRPPGKLPMKQLQDPLSKPVSVSIKPAEISSLASARSMSPMRKHSPSPTHGRSSSMGKQQMSPISKSSGSSKLGSSSHHLKHSVNSPKHSASPSPIPSASPKHQSSNSAGKPSMSTLKSATNSPSSKSGENRSKLSNSSRERERKSLSFTNSNVSKMKPSTVKLKQLDLTPTSVEINPLALTNDALASPTDLSKSGNNGASRNKKGCLSAVIDKLKSQHCTTEPDPIGTSVGKSGSNSSSPQNIRVGPGSSNPGTYKILSSKPGDGKNSEYMVKSSSDGIKITINKTKSSKTSSSKMGGSPKIHTGLKPGVNSGPASKKPQSKPSNKMSSGQLAGGKYSSGSQKNNLYNQSKSKSTSNRQRPLDSGAYKNISSQSKIDQATSQLIVESLIKKPSLDSKYQIPKLSARNNQSDDKNKPPKPYTDFVDNKRNSIPSSVSVTLSSVNNVRNPLSLDGKEEPRVRDPPKDDKLSVFPVTSSYSNVNDFINFSMKSQDGSSSSAGAVNANFIREHSNGKFITTTYKDERAKSDLATIKMVTTPSCFSNAITMSTATVSPLQDPIATDSSLLDFSAKLLSNASIAGHHNRITSSPLPGSPSVSVHLVKSNVDGVNLSANVPDD